MKVTKEATKMSITPQKSVQDSKENRKTKVMAFDESSEESLKEGDDSVA
jgi:hypothetical protein